jgi:hypothetical protein
LTNYLSLDLLNGDMKEPELNPTVKAEALGDEEILKAIAAREEEMKADILKLKVRSSSFLFCCATFTHI